MISPSPRARFIPRFLLTVTLVLVLLVSAISIYVNTGQNKEESLETASRLPGQFVFHCIQVSSESRAPWYYLAAYYQVSMEKPGEADVYPSKETIRKLAGKIASSDSRSIKGKLKKMVGRQDAELILHRGKVLKKNGALFSAEYIFPVKQDKMWYSDTWLAPRDGGNRQHFGTDIFAPEGTPVYACTEGTISRMGWNELGGNRIGLVGDRDGIYYYYAHLRSYAPGLIEGSHVSKGQFLGTVGHTGNAVDTPDHLHFGMLFHWKKWINPYNFLVYWELQHK